MTDYFVVVAGLRGPEPQIFHGNPPLLVKGRLHNGARIMHNGGPHALDRRHSGMHLDQLLSEWHHSIALGCPTVDKKARKVMAAS